MIFLLIVGNFPYIRLFLSALQDVARLMVHCIQSEDCSGVFNAVAPELVTNQQFVQVGPKAVNGT